MDGLKQQHESVLEFLTRHGNDIVAAGSLLGLPHDEAVCLAVRELFRKKAVDAQQGELFGKQTNKE